MKLLTSFSECLHCESETSATGVHSPAQIEKFCPTQLCLDIIYFFNFPLFSMLY